MQVIITEKIADEGIRYLQEQGFTVELKYGLSRQELLQTISMHDGLIVRSATKVDRELLDRATNLKVIGRAGVGVDNIDVEYCTEKGIIVVNTPDGNTMAAAELAVGLAFSIFRNIPQAHSAAKYKNDFRRTRFVGNEMDGKTVGIVGLGRIGSVVATKLKGCNMRAVGYDPYVTEDRFSQLGVEPCATLQELLTQSDLISVHMPKTPETHNMIGKEEFSLCKDGVRIVNAARGGIINEEALLEALLSGKVAAAGIDVLSPEPNYTKTPEEQDFCHPLLELDQVVFTPHLGASTEEASYNVGVDVAKLVSKTLQGEFVAAVNMASLKKGSLEELKPFLTLAETLGKIYYQTEKEKVQKLEVIFGGDLLNLDTALISLSAAKGFISPIQSESVNYVNISSKLKTMGVELIETRTSATGKYAGLLTLKFHTKHGELAVSGTVFGKDEIRIVEFYGYPLNFEPTPIVLALQNIDRPGMIGKIGVLLGAKNINIASFHLGRKTRGEKAISFVSVDSHVSEEVIKSLSTIDGILKVSCIQFE